MESQLSSTLKYTMIFYPALHYNRPYTNKSGAIIHMYPRAKAFGIALHHDRLLVQEYHTGNGTYYRPLGGSIELGEKSADTVIREFKEELHTEVEIIDYLGCLENIFHLDGEIGHEIIQLYSLRLLDTSLYGVPSAFRKKTTLRICKILYIFSANLVTNENSATHPG